MSVSLVFDGPLYLMKFHKLALEPTFPFELNFGIALFLLNLFFGVDLLMDFDHYDFYNID